MTHEEEQHEEVIPSEAIKVGNIIKVEQNERIPADLVMLYTTEPTGDVFIRTDQLDGETDWKLRKAIQSTQKEFTEKDRFENTLNSLVIVEPPHKAIYDFKGKFYYEDDNHVSEYDERLSLDHTLWANSVLASKGFIYDWWFTQGRRPEIK